MKRFGRMFRRRSFRETSTFGIIQFWLLKICQGSSRFLLGVLVRPNIKKETQQKMTKSVESLKANLVKIRTGRAHPTLLDGIKVDYYGNETPLSQVSSIKAEDARNLLLVVCGVLRSLDTTFYCTYTDFLVIQLHQHLSLL